MHLCCGWRHLSASAALAPGSLFSRGGSLRELPAVPGDRGRPQGSLKAHHHQLPLGGCGEKAGHPQKFLLCPLSLLGSALALDRGQHEISAHLRVRCVNL